jgi:hypothetical protein
MKRFMLALILTGCGLSSVGSSDEYKSLDDTRLFLPQVDDAGLPHRYNFNARDTLLPVDASMVEDANQSPVCKFPESTDFMCREFNLACQPGFAASVCTAADCMAYCLSVNELRNTPSSPCRDLYQPNCAGSFNVEKWCEFRVAANGTCICSVKLH